MKIYYSPAACSMATHIMLEEAGLKYQAIKVDLREKKTETGADFFKVNPKGQVPVLETDDGQILTEGAVLLQFVADQSPEKNLLPKLGTWERYKANEWLNYVATEIHKGMVSFFTIDSMVANKEGNAEFRTAATANLSKKLDFLSEHFKNNQFLLGNQFSAADSYLFTILNWHGWLKFDLTKWPAIMSYMERIKSRPSVQKVMKAEGLI